VRQDLSALSTCRNQERKMNMKTKTNLLASGMLLAALANAFCQPVITKQPASRTASLFADATFRVTAIGDAPLSYQWRFKEPT
jgi:hypothetical protein